MKTFLVGLVAGVSMALAASSAMAVPTATINTAPDYAALAAYSTSTGGGTFSVDPATVFTASDDGIVRSPFEGGGVGSPGFYAAGPLPATAPNPAVLSFSSLMSSFSFLWGSPDEYNEITFYNGASAVGTLASFLGPVPGLFTGAGAVFVSVTDILFDRVEFFSDEQQAIEFASISAVPIPAGLPLLGAGVALLGYLGMRRKRNAATAA